MSILNIAIIAITSIAVWEISKIIKSILRFFSKKEPKSNKEYDIQIFVNGDKIFYNRNEIEKVDFRGKKYIGVMLKTGTWISYEGFSFIVSEYKIQVNEESK